MRLCTKEGCTRKHKARGLCASHYTMLLRIESGITTGIRVTYDACRIEGCKAPMVDSGWCGPHIYEFVKKPQRKRRRGKLTKDVQPYRNPRIEVAKVDKDDLWAFIKKDLNLA